MKIVNIVVLAVALTSAQVVFADKCEDGWVIPQENACKAAWNRSVEKHQLGGKCKDISIAGDPVVYGCDVRASCLNAKGTYVQTGTGYGACDLVSVCADGNMTFMPCD